MKDSYFGIEFARSLTSLSSAVVDPSDLNKV
jgi:hypothetical protein